MNFYDAFLILMQHEGGYSNHADDPGKATMWGITEAVARENGWHGEMRDLTKDFAAGIYYVRYWQAVKADQLPDQIKFDVFDAAVNSGPGQAIKWLQRAVGTTEDGVIGPKTLAAAHAASGLKVRYSGTRLAFLTNLPTWPTFGKGWARRVAANLMMEA